MYIIRLIRLSLISIILGVAPYILYAQTWQMHRDSALFYQEEGKYPQAISNTGKAIELYKKTVSVYDTSYSRLLKLQVENHYYVLCRAT